MSENAGYTIQEAAEIIGVSSRQVRRYIKQGKLEAHLENGKFGEEYRIPQIPQDLSKPRAAKQPSGMSGVAERKPAGKALDTSELADYNPLDKYVSKRNEPIDITSNKMALEIIKRLEEENRNLAGQLGAAQARVKQLESELRLLEDRKRTPWWKRLFRF